MVIYITEMLFYSHALFLYLKGTCHALPQSFLLQEWHLYKKIAGEGSYKADCPVKCTGNILRVYLDAQKTAQ